MTSDRIIYIFGKAAPKLSLLISMILALVPKTVTRFKQIRSAQKCIGRDITDGSPVVRLKNTVRIISCMLQQTLENSIETADSLKSRGYGLPNRTSFSVFRFTVRDCTILLFMALCDILLLIGCFSGITDFYYFPMIKPVVFGYAEAGLYVTYFLMCIMPLVLDIAEDTKWKAIKSKI